MYKFLNVNNDPIHLNESPILELMPTWNCFSSTKLHRAVREGTGRRVEVTLDFEAAATSLH